MGEIISSKDVRIEGLNKTLYEIILDQSSDPIFCFDNLGTYLYINAAFSKAFNLMPSDIVGKWIWDVFPGAAGDMRYAAVKRAYETKSEVVIDVKVPAYDGERFYITTVTPVLDQYGEPKAAICISKEITQRKRMEIELEREKIAVITKNLELDSAVKELYEKTITDGLTGLYTRQYTIDQMNQSFEVWKSRRIPCCIGFMDLDYYKNINDLYGHLVGDQVLREFSRDLNAHFDNQGIVGRFGGEEFLLVLDHTDKAIGIKMMEEFIEVINNKTYTEEKINLTVSIGLVEYKGESINQLLKAVDDMLYLAKDKGRNRLEVR